MALIESIRESLEASINPHSRPDLFFKTGKGEYADGDKFLGVPVPELRKIAKQYSDMSRAQIKKLLASPFNEERTLALIILVKQFECSDENGKSDIYQFYLANKSQVNNWNLVDCSAHLIVGAYLFNKDKSILFELATSPLLWDRRIAIVSTWYFIRAQETAWTFSVAKLLLHDKEDLIHKAVGWMLREAGKKEKSALKDFLNAHATQMPRTMLRYAIEKFDTAERQFYMNLKKAS